jgi:drug/metabolite transporter (DMT)-like permease
MASKKLLVFAALCVIWGSTWLAASASADQLPPMWTAALRFLLGATFLLPILLVRKLNFPRGRQLGASLILSGTMIAFPFALIVWSQGRLSPGITAVLFAFTPLIAGFFGDFIALTRLPQGALYALIFGIAGVALLFSSAISVSPDQSAAIAVTFLAVASAAVSSVYAKRELAPVHPVVSTVTQLSFAAFLLALLSVILERGQPWTWTQTNLTTLILLSIAASSVAYPLYFWLLKETEPWQIGTIQWFEPLVAIAEGALLFRQPISWRMVGGAALLLFCSARVFIARSRDDDAVTLQITD